MAYLTSIQDDIPRQDPLTVMTLGDLRAESDGLAVAIGIEAQAKQPDISDDDWGVLIDSIIARLSVVRPETDTYSELLQSTTSLEERLALAWRVAQVKRALDDVPSNYGKDYGPTATVLLPLSYARRFALLVGEGVLPLVWVRALDVCRF